MEFLQNLIAKKPTSISAASVCGAALRHLRLAGSALGLAAWLVFSAQAVLSHDMHAHGDKKRGCADRGLVCALTVTPAFAPDGSLWIVWATPGSVSAAHSTDLGRSFAEEHTLNSAPAQIDWGPDARPKIVIDKQGRIFVTFTVLRDKAFNGEVFYTVSADGGKTFSPPAPITASVASQRFDALALAPNGKVFAAWIDKRNRAPAAAKGQSYPGAAIAFAWADPNEARIGEVEIARDNSCECCRIAAGFTSEGNPVVAFRNVFDGKVRDHALIAFTEAGTPGPLRRVSTDDWVTDACPHQGPSLAISQDGAFHIAWYTDGRVRQGLFYAHSMNGGATFSDPMPVGDPAHNPSRPFLLASEGTLFLVWKEFDGEHTVIHGMASHDDGQSWSAAAELARTGGDSDYPLLIGRNGQIFLSWMTHDEGYRLISVGDRS